MLNCDASPFPVTNSRFVRCLCLRQRRPTILLERLSAWLLVIVMCSYFHALPWSARLARACYHPLPSPAPCRPPISVCIPPQGVAPSLFWFLCFLSFTFVSVSHIAVRTVLSSASRAFYSRSVYFCRKLRDFSNEPDFVVASFEIWNAVARLLAPS